MTKRVQRRRGTSTQHTSFTGAEGELTVDTTNKSVRVHDGTTAGGIQMARADLANVSDANLNSALNGNTLSSLTITTATITGGTINGTTIGGTTAAAITGTTITATGDVTIPDKIVHAGDTNTAIRFPANDTVTVETNGDERFRVTSTGNVGIGTISPTSLLHLSVQDDGGSYTPAAQLNAGTNGPLFQTRIINTSDDAGSESGLLLQTGSANPSQWTITNQKTASNAGDLILRTRTGASASAERARITSAGNVGIGTTSPATALDVNGQISGKFTDVGTNVAAQALATNHVSQVTISANTTLTTTVPPAGSTATVIIVTSGATSRTVTFGTGFASTGTLATGTTADRRFVVAFVSDGTRLLEVSRTTAITV